MKTATFRAAMMVAAFSLATVSVALPSSAAAAAQSKAAAGKAEKLTQSFVWYDGNREQKVWLDPQLVAEFNPGPQGEKAVKSAYSSARVYTPKHQQAGIRFWRVDNSYGAAPRNINARNPEGKYSPVLHDGPSSGSRMRALPGNIIVYFDAKWDDGKVNAWLKAHKLEMVKKLQIGQNAYVIKTGPGLEALEVANALYKLGEVKAAFPDWWQEVTTR